MSKRKQGINGLGLAILVVGLGLLMLYLVQCRGMTLTDIFNDAVDHSPGGEKSQKRKLYDDVFSD